MGSATVVRTGEVDSLRGNAQGIFLLSQLPHNYCCKDLQAIESTPRRK